MKSRVYPVFQAGEALPITVSYKRTLGNSNPPFRGVSPANVPNTICPPWRWHRFSTVRENIAGVGLLKVHVMKEKLPRDMEKFTVVLPKLLVSDIRHISERHSNPLMVVSPAWIAYHALRIGLSKVAKELRDLELGLGVQVHEQVNRQPSSRACSRVELLADVEEAIGAKSN